MKKLVMALLAYVAFRAVVNTTRELLFADTGEDRAHE